MPKAVIKAPLFRVDNSEDFFALPLEIDVMPKGRITLRPTVKRGIQLPTGKGWRLVRPRQQRGFKAALLQTFRSKGERFAIFRIVR